MGYLKAVGVFAWRILGRPEVREAVVGFLERELQKHLEKKKSA